MSALVGSRYNSLQDYQNQFGQALDTKNVDELDDRILTKFHFPDYENGDLCKLWGRAFARIDVPEEDLQNPVDWDSAEGYDFPFKRQAVRVLVKRCITLFSPKEDSQDPNPPELDAILRICRAVRLMFHGPTHRLDFLFLKMDPVPIEIYRQPMSLWNIFSGEKDPIRVKDLHPLQWAPHPKVPNNWMPKPPRSCWKDPNQWSHDDWPENHMVSWDHCYSLLLGLFRSGKNFLHIENFLSSNGELFSVSGSGPLDLYVIIAYSSTFGMLLGLVERPSDLCINFTLSELAETENYSAIKNFPTEIKERILDISNPRVLINLIRLQIPLSTVFDFSEAATNKPTTWREGDLSGPFAPCFHIACEFGDKWMVEAFMENREAFRLYYKSLKDLSDTPYKRAVRNREFPEVLIPLLKEVARDPQGRLAQEIREIALNPHEYRGMLSGISTYLGLWTAYEPWRRAPQNHLILACEMGSLELAKYLIESKEKEAEEMALNEPEEIDRINQAAEIVSEFVNRPGSFGAPSKTPIEIAVKGECREIVSLLHAKGAQTTAELELQMQGNLTEEMADILRKSREERERLSKEVRETGYNGVITGKLIGQLSRIETQYRERLSKIEQQLNRNDSLQDGLEEHIKQAGQIGDVMEALNELLDSLKEAKRRVFLKNCRNVAITNDASYAS